MRTNDARAYCAGNRRPECPRAVSNAEDGLVRPESTAMRTVRSKRLASACSQAHIQAFLDHGYRYPSSLS